MSLNRSRPYHIFRHMLLAATSDLESRAAAQASNPEDMLWLMSRAGYKPVMEYLGGTEIGGAFVGSTMLHPCIPSCFATASLGFELFILGEPSADADPATSAATPGARAESLSAPDVGRARLRGEVAVRMPAVGAAQALLNRDHYEEYFAGMPVVDGLPLRRHGDELEELPGLGFLRAHGRCDDTMNLGGIKVRTPSLQELCVYWGRRLDAGSALCMSCCRSCVPTVEGVWMYGPPWVGPALTWLIAQATQSAPAAGHGQR